MKAKVFFCGLALGAVLFSRYDGNFLFDIWLAVRPIFVGMLIAVFLWPISCFLERYSDTSRRICGISFALISFS